MSKKLIIKCRKCGRQLVTGKEIAHCFRCKEATCVDCWLHKRYA